MRKRIVYFISQHKFFLLTIIIYCFLQYIFFYTSHKVILGAEGNYWIDWQIYLQKFGYTWLGSVTGMIATSLNSFLSLPLIFMLLNNLPLAFKSFLLVSSLFILPFGGMYFLLKNLDPAHSKSALFFALFFVVNPFTLLFLNTLHPWLAHTLFIFPLYFLILFKYYDRPWRLFTLVGIVSFLFAYTNANPPLMVLINGSFLIFVPLVQLVKFNKIFWKECLKKLLVIYAALFLLNLWWIGHWVIALSEVSKIYPEEFARTWMLDTSSRSKISILSEVFSLSWLVPKIPDYNFFEAYYNFPVVKFLLFIPFFILIAWFLAKNQRAKEKKIIYFLSGFLFLLILFLKGHNAPFQNLLLNCFNYVPFCQVFKTPAEKFGTLFIFGFTLLLFYISKNLPRKWVKYLLCLYLVICLVPFLSGKFIPDYKIEEGRFGSRQYIDERPDQEFRQAMQKKKLDYRLLSLPTGGNYQVMMHINKDKYYTGLDPVLYNIPQAFIADYSDRQLDHLFLTLDSPFHPTLLSLYNIKNIHFNRRLYPWFGNLAGKSIPEQEASISQRYPKIKDYGTMSLYDNARFLPHFYTPATVLVTQKKLNTLPEIIATPGYALRSAIYFTQQNPEREDEIQALTRDYPALPVLEFRKINPTKYRVIIHQARGSFPLVFSETFHKLWKAYLVKTQNARQPRPTSPSAQSKAGGPSPAGEANGGQAKLKAQSLKRYALIKGNEGEQANKEMVEGFIEEGWISAVEKEEPWWRKGQENGQTDFISQNFQGTIQNDNLPTRHLWETWSPKNAPPLPETNHWVANSYANSWIIKTEELCKAEGMCRQNSDGSYDLELVIEFWPQRVFYFTLSISTLAFLVCVSLLLFRKRTKRRKKFSKYDLFPKME